MCSFKLWTPLCSFKLWTPLGKYQGVRLLDHMIRMFGFLRSHQTVFRSGCTILDSHKKWMRVLVAPHLHQHLVLPVFQVLAILIGVWWYLSVVLICISLMTYDIEHLFICWFSICISSLVRCLLKSLVHFLIRLFVFLLLSCKGSLYI